MSTQTVRLVTRNSDGSIRERDYEGVTDLLKSYEQIGIDDCSTDLSLRGLPVVKGLVGPIPAGKGIARYETADVFEELTKEWARAKVKRRRRRSDQTTAAVPVVDGLSGGFDTIPTM